MPKGINGIPRKDFQWKKTKVMPDLSGKKVAIVGGTGGIGRALAKDFAANGAQVTVVGRKFHDEGVNNLSFIRCDMSSLKDAQKVAHEINAEELDYLILTTGIFATKERVETAEGLEADMAISYWSRLVIIREIADKLGTARSDQSTKARVFVWGFPGTSQAVSMDDQNSEKSYVLLEAHQKTMLGNESLVLEFTKRYPHLNIYGMNPGLLKSDIRTNVTGSGILNKITEALIYLIFGDPTRYSKKIVPLITSPKLENMTGSLFNNKPTAIEPSTFSTDEFNEKVVKDSEAIVDPVLNS